MAKRKQLLRDNEDRLRTLRWRLGYVYGLKLDAGLLDDDEFEQLDALSARVIERVPQERDPGAAIEAHKAHRYADGLEKLLGEQPQQVQEQFRESNARLVEFARATGRVPGQTQLESIEQGHLTADSIGNVRALTHPPLNFANLDEGETMTLETLAAKAAGLKPTHFADSRAMVKIRALARRASAPRWEDGADVIAAVMASKRLTDQCSVTDVYDAGDVAVLFWALSSLAAAGGEHVDVRTNLGLYWPRIDDEGNRDEAGRITRLGGASNIPAALDHLEANGWLIIERNGNPNTRRVSLGPAAIEEVDAYRKRIAKWKRRELVEATA